MLNETSEKRYTCCLLWTFERVLPDSSEHQYCFLYINKFGIYIIGILLSAKSKNKAKYMLPCTSCSFQFNGVKLKILTNVSERVHVSTLCGLAGNLLTSHGLAPSQPPPVILPQGEVWATRACLQSPPKSSSLSWNGFKSPFNLKGGWICVFFCSSSTWEVLC